MVLQPIGSTKKVVMVRIIRPAKRQSIIGSGRYLSGRRICLIIRNF